MPQPGPRVAALGNDGSVQSFREWRCPRTAKEANPWWEVDLGGDHTLARVQLWKAMTYHTHAKHPDGMPPVNSTASTGAPAPPLWVFVSQAPFERNASVADLRVTSGVVAQELQLGHDNRVGTVRFDDAVIGRFVRIQHESGASGSVLQFAELEVFAEPEELAIGCDQEQHDGFYGVESGLDGDLVERVDSEWLLPSATHASVRFWIGSFTSASPAVQWLPEALLPHERTDAVAIELQYHQRTGSDAAGAGKQWTSVPVDTRSSELLDKESTALRAVVDTLETDTVDVSGYLNNPSKSTPQADKSASTHWLLQCEWMTQVAPERVQMLLDKVETLTFAAGSSVLRYGEQKRAVYFVREGELALLGPSTAVGAKTLGTLARHTIFNERSLFGGWAHQPAAFQGSSSLVVCESLSFEALVDVLGTDTVASIRDTVIRRMLQPTAASTEPTERTLDPVTYYTDATRALVFRTKAPLAVLDGDSASVAALSHRFDFSVFAFDTATKQRGRKLGTARLLPSQFSAHGEGYVTLPIVSSGTGTLDDDVVGQLTLTYLVIKPFVHAKNTVASVWRSYWRPRAPLNVGHRGMGRSFHQVAGFRHALTRENSLASLILAGRSGADFVEFDVQLTRDRVPVLYHDFVLRVGLEDKHAWAHGARAEPFDVGIHELSLRQLQRSQTAPTTSVVSKNVLQQHVRKHWTRVVGSKKQPLASALGMAASEADDEHLVEFFPTLEALLKHVPAEVGLNVEIKYPDNLWRLAMRHSAPFAINAYVDAILTCVFTHAGENRRIVFSCFDADVCVAVRLKQAKYPVLFLTFGSVAPQAFDARLTLQFAVNFANMETLGGIVSNSDAFLSNPELVQVVKRAAVGDKRQRETTTGGTGTGTAQVLLTWGDKNTSHACVQLQKQHAIDGVISDNIGDLMHHDRKLSAAPQ